MHAHEPVFKLNSRVDDARYKKFRYLFSAQKKGDNLPKFVKNFTQT